MKIKPNISCREKIKNNISVKKITIMTDTSANIYSIGT